MKKLEEFTEPKATELGKRVIPDGKSKGVVVLAYRHGDDAPQVVVQEFKKKSGWQTNGASRHSAATWHALAAAIADLTKG